MTCLNCFCRKSRVPSRRDRGVLLLPSMSHPSPSSMDLRYMRDGKRKPPRTTRDPQDVKTTKPPGPQDTQSSTKFQRRRDRVLFRSIFSKKQHAEQKLLVSQFHRQGMNQGHDDGLDTRRPQNRSRGATTNQHIHSIDPKTCHCHHHHHSTRRKTNELTLAS